MTKPFEDRLLREAVARALRRLRKRGGYSQMKLHQQTQISLRHITNMESGENNPGAELIARYLEPLGVSWMVFGREVDRERKAPR